MRNNQLRFIKRVIYRLRQSYGFDTDYYRVSDVRTNYELGHSENTITKYTIKKVIRLPSKFVRLFQDDRTHTPSTRTFSNGVWFDKKIKKFILDNKMIPKGLIPEIDDYLIIDGLRFDVKEVVKLEQNIGFLLVCESVEGAYLDDLESINQIIKSVEIISYVLN